MKHKRPPIPVLVLIALVVIVGGYILITGLAARANGALGASGTIEAVSVTLSPEIGGKVAEVYVQEGDSVQAGEALFRLDDTLLQAQRAAASASLDLARAASATAQAALASAQANYDLAAASARLESASLRTADWTSEFSSTIPQSDEIVAAMNEVEAALAGREAALETLSSLISAPEADDFSTAEKRLLDARAGFLVAQSVLQRANLATNSDLRDAAQAAYDAASEELDAAQEAYDELKDEEAAQAILTARGEQAAAEERYQAAQDRLLGLQSGDYSLKLSAALAALRQAMAAADQAELAIAQAEANLAVIDAQIAKLTVTAPMEGVILTRAVEPGEVIPAGSTAIKLARLDDLTITVFIPEDRYGELSLGQTAEVRVDSFPETIYTASILHIADEAEFTPRNVQTVEGRSSTVYAIQLRVDNLDGKLKPGMPADVTFDD